jgi:sialate O-acetylesterase
MKNSILAFLTVFLFFSNTIIFAKIKLPSIIASNMVLQRNTTVKIWGWATPGEKITLTGSWISELLKITTSDNGRWEIAIKTTLSKEPQSIQLKSNQSNINLDNILFGEVWICSGQSNMRMPLKGFTGQPTFEGNLSVATSKNTNLRLGLIAGATTSSKKSGLSGTPSLSESL